MCYMFSSFFGFNSFVNHIKKHESELAVSRSEEVDNFLSSQSSNSADVSTDTSCVIESLHEPGNSGLARIISSSFLGKQSRVYSWCKAKYQQGSYDGTFCCKFKNCSVQNLSLSNYTSHLSNYHGAASSFTCPFCPREFYSLIYLNKHATKEHLRFIKYRIDPLDPGAESETNEDLSMPYSNDCVEIVEDSDLSERISRLTDGTLGENVLLRMLGDISTTWNQAFLYLGATKNFTEDIMKTVHLCLGIISSDCPNVLSSATFRDLLKAAGDFNFCQAENEYQVLKLLKQKKHFVMPCDIVFGVEHEIRLSKGKSTHKEVERTGQLVSISKVLENTVFHHDEIFSIMASYSCLLESLRKNGIIFDSMQTLGKLNLSENANETNPLSDVDLVIKHSESDEVFNLSLQLYFDEVEPVNPIGSRASIHKIGCFHWCLKNLPPWLLSDMRMTHLAALVPYLDIETYGFKEVLTVLRNDLLALEKGIQILTRSGKTVFVALRRVDFVADNLAYHAVFGFNKSFSGGLCCEKCVLPQSLFKSVFEERDKDFRSSES